MTEEDLEEAAEEAMEIVTVALGIDVVEDTEVAEVVADFRIGEVVEASAEAGAAVQEAGMKLLVKDSISPDGTS